MEQEIQLQPLEDKNNIMMVVVVSVLVTAFVVGTGVYLFLKKPTLPNQTVSQKQETPVVNKTIYFGEGSQGKYSLVNVQTGETKEFVLPGYTIVDQHNYNNFPDFLILQKENDLYSYSVKNKISNSIFGSSNDLKLKKNEEARIDPSITENNKFFIVINEYDPNEEPGMGGPTPISTRSYFFDASINKLKRTENVDFEGCRKYDSKNQRFFTWPCGEGIGSVTPLSFSDLNTGLQREVATSGELGLSRGVRPLVEYQGGLFFVLNNSKDLKIIIIDPQLANPMKEVYVANDQVKSQISDISAYSVSIDGSTSTLIIGGDSYILLLRYDANKKITQSEYIPDKDIYANFMFVNEGKLYYQAKDTIRVISLGTWQIEKSIPSPGSFQEITLFRF